MEEVEGISKDFPKSLILKSAKFTHTIEDIYISDSVKLPTMHGKIHKNWPRTEVFCKSMSKVSVCVERDGAMSPLRSSVIPAMYMRVFSMMAKRSGLSVAHLMFQTSVLHIILQGIPAVVLSSSHTYRENLNSKSMASGPFLLTH